MLLIIQGQMAGSEEFMIVNIFLFINYYLYFKIVTMVQKIKDTFSFVKAKIGGDQLDQKLVESVSEENWQTSTHILHQIANAAYNYQKWQRISEFIWDKLKKGKSWRKILKTLNLIEFLLKNGPQSVITNFKYDIYQLRTFQNYSHYSDGNDRGQPIRQRAKAVVNLLNNQQLLQEERVKAKTIRQKMSNVLGNSNNYGAGGYGGGSSYNKSYDNYDKGNKYDNYDKKKVSNKDNSYKYGNEGLGVYGDYTYNKSTLDKYKDKVNEPTTTANNYSKKQEEKKPEIIVQTKKPFQQSVSKLAKPGQKKPNQTESAKVETNNTNKSNNNTIINILDDPVPSSNYQQPQQPQKQPQQQSQQQFVQPQPQQSNNNLSNDLNFFGTVSTSAQNNPVNTSQQQQLNNNLYNQPNNNQPTNPSANNQQPANQPFYPPQQQNPNFNKPIPQQNYSLNQQQTMYPQNNYNPMQYNQANLTGYQQPQMGYPQQNIAYQPNVAYQGQPYGAYQGVPAQQFQGQYNPYYGQPNQYGVNQAMGYGVGQVPQQQPPQIQANLNLNINLSGVNTKQQQQFGNFNGVSSASNVNWLSSKEKGLIDFSDFGSQIKNEQKQANKNEQINNNIKMDTWSW